MNRFRRLPARFKLGLGGIKAGARLNDRCQVVDALGEPLRTPVPYQRVSPRQRDARERPGLNGIRAK
jgi:hypothetical protein